MQQRVTHAEVQEVKWNLTNGKYSMEGVPGSTRLIEADLILLAMGFVHPVYEGLLEELQVERDPRNNVSVGSGMQTSLDKVFAAGDAVNGASLVVTAIASGRKVARLIDDFLTGSDEKK
jgi:glutamate synthase (NADPH/NADH) small chain